MNRLFTVAALLLLLLSNCTNQKRDTNLLRDKINQIVSSKNAVVGVSIIGNNGRDTLSLNGDKAFPMQSVFKLHIALAVLSEVDKGNLYLDQLVKIDKDEFLPEDFWSPLRDHNPNGGQFSIAQLIQYAVSLSDNTACDVLISLVGTPKMVEQYIQECGIEEIQITYNEADMQAQWENMFQNWTTPNAASKTLKLFFENDNKLLSDSSHSFFLEHSKTNAHRQREDKGSATQGNCGCTQDGLVWHQ